MPNTKQKPAAQQMDAIELLTEDHKKVKKLFKEFESIKNTQNSEDKKSALVNEILMELTIHTQLEEEIFYPAVRAALDDQDVMDEAEVEHAGAKELISQLETMSPGDDLYDAKVKVLSEYVEHHVKEEETEMFPLTKKTKLDMGKLGTEMMELKEELETDMEELSAPIKAGSKKTKAL